MCGALPAFLIGALSVQIRQDLGFSVALVGAIIGTAFAAAGVLSAPMGRVAQALGPARALRVGVSVSMLTMLAVAGLARAAWQFFVIVAVAGAANALNQPAANLLLSDRISGGSLGLATAVKQSGMPAAVLLGGAAVPAIALTVGWRWAFVAAACLALVAVAVQPVGTADRTTLTAMRGVDRRPDLPVALLARYGTVGFLGAFSAGAVATLLTSAATDAGISEGSAGWLLSVGSAVGIASRLFQGWSVDHRGLLPIQRLVSMFGVGAVGVAFMSLTTPLAYLIAVFPAFAAGWAWPGLFNLSVIRNNPSAPASATGVTQIGIFAGAGAGPVVGGGIVEVGGYRPLWITASVALGVGSMIAVTLRNELRRRASVGTR